MSIVSIFHSVWLLLLVGCLAVAQSSDLSRTRSRFVATDRYLESLGLTELRIDLLERQLEQRTSGADSDSQQHDLARQLLSLYGQQMMQLDQGDQHPRWLRRCRQLLQQHPDLDTPSLQIAMGQAMYLQNERDFRQWWAAGGDSSWESKDQATAITTSRLVQSIEETNRLLDKVQQELQSLYDQQLTQLQASVQNRSQLAVRLGQTDAELAHCSYLLGWNHYFLGIAQAGKRRENLKKSDAHLRHFLQLDPKEVLTKLQPAWIDFYSEWKTRALAGLAMCHWGLEHEQQSQHCFQLIDRHVERQSTRDMIYAWRLNARLYVHDYRQLDELLLQAKTDPGMSDAGRVRFWLEVWAGADAICQRADGVAVDLRLHALAGLARQFQAEELQRCLTQLQSAPNRSGSFTPAWQQRTFLREWVLGSLALDGLGIDSADQGLSRLGWVEKSQQHFSTALQHAQNAEPLEVAMVRFLQARASVAAGQWQSGGQQLLDVSKTLDSLGRRPLAAQANWLAIGALTRLSTSDPKQSLQALEALDQLTARYPESSFARQAELVRTRLSNLNRDPVDAIEALRKFGPTSINAAAARFEIARLEYQRWQAEFEKQIPNASQQRLEDLKQAVADIARVENGTLFLTQATLLLINAQLQSHPGDLTVIERQLREMEQDLDDSPQRESVWPELRYNQLLVAVSQNDLEHARELLQDLAQRAPESPYYRRAAIESARQADQWFQEATVEQKPLRMEITAELFGQLVNALGDDDSQLSASTNARIAFARSAEFTRLMGDPVTAADQFQRLHRLFPQRREYYRQLAISWQAAGKYSTAIEPWRRLAAAASAGSDDWFEAKLGLIECLLATEQPEEARQVLEQTIQLSDSIPERWQQPVTSLRSKLNVE